jgi:hypothetical protein
VLVTHDDQLARSVLEFPGAIVTASHAARRIVPAPWLIPRTALAADNSACAHHVVVDRQAALDLGKRSLHHHGT